jgi:tRNA modification GTPase
MAAPDTIVAIATAAGRGAVGILRISGPEVPRLAAQVLGRLPPPRLATLAHFRAADAFSCNTDASSPATDASSLDTGIALFFRAPASFTGEDVLELQGHGGPVVLELLRRRLLELGCRAARPGEFTERAFLNGKLDLAQAEAVADLIDAGSAAAARAATRSLAGEFSRRVRDLQAELTALRVTTEAELDFPDEDLDLDRSGPRRRTQAERVLATCEALLATARRGALLRQGLVVVIAGRPNAGKSSLMNRLAEDDVAIVSDLPGTTRDVLRQGVHIDGIPLHLVDTAGLRAPGDAIEAEGIRRATAELRRADRILYVVDATAHGPARADDADLAAQLAELPGDVPTTVVYNKIDLLDVAPWFDAAATPPALAVSATTGAGFESLRAHLRAAAGGLDLDGDVLSARGRHVDALLRARAHLGAAAAALAAGAPAELFAEDLAQAQHALGEITGEFTSDDLLGRIFASFCIGK